MGTFTDDNPAPLPGQGWIPTFFDGFNAVFLDRAAWPLVQWGWGANGAFRYDPANIVQWGGEVAINSQSTPGGWTSGAFSQGWNGQLYGRYEIRAALDKGQGVSAALLLWPTDDNGGWETDIMEFRSGDRTRNAVVLHGPADAQVFHFDNFDASQWHTYTLDWLPGSLTLHLDGQKILETSQLVPDEPMSLGFLGYVGKPGEVWTFGGPDATTPGFVSWHVDWVRISTPDFLFPGQLPPALYGTSAADLRPTTKPYTGLWTAGPVGDEYALTGVRSVGATPYAATRNAAQWNDRITLVADAPAGWDPSYASRLLFANVTEVALDFRAAGTTALDLVVSGAMRGNIATAEGADSILLVVHSSGAGPGNVTTIVSGGGADRITVTAPALTGADDPFAWGAEWNGAYAGQFSTVRINAGPGDDTVTLLAGSVIVDGGAGTDTAVFEGAPRARFQVEALADGSTRVQDTTGALGTAILWGVERLQFADAAIAAPGQAAWSGAPIAIGPVGATPDLSQPPPASPPPPDPVTPPPPPPPAQGGSVDWNALAAAVMAHHEATGEWWADDLAEPPGSGGGAAPPPAPDIAPAPVDWNALAAQVMANFQATGGWFV